MDLGMPEQISPAEVLRTRYRTVAGSAVPTLIDVLPTRSTQ